MWITAKSLTRDMNNGDYYLESKITDLEEKQQNEIGRISEQLTQISEKLDVLEKKVTECFGKNDAHMEELSKMRQEQITQLTGTVRETQKSIDTVGTVMSDAFRVVQDREDVAAKTIETMNDSMNEILKNLMSLDEGNRLIIAKMLLKDMEV